ncbi:MAG: hypothetical protein QW727_00930 [Candidatus Pacearchaeota archaeon]
MEVMKLEQAFEFFSKEKKRKFDQTIELIVNLKKFDLKKNSINVFIILPHKIKDKKICAFIDSQSNIVDTIPKAAFQKYKDKKDLKNLVKNYDFFIASEKNMTSVATTFGRVLGPAGKMPSPKLGIIINENDDEIKKILDKINRSIKINTKDSSVKIPIGKYSMERQKIIDNIKSAYISILNELPNGKENVKNIMVKLTMGKPIKIEI